MARLKKQEAGKMLANTADIRLRAAWLYYRGQMKQQEVAAKLGVSRTTVVRMLDEAVKRNEVQIVISAQPNYCVELALQLEKKFQLDEAIVVPVAEERQEDATNVVGQALGQFLSEVIPDNCTVGVGWGRTLTASLPNFQPMRHQNVNVVSLLGGVISPREANPVEYSWRLASLMDANCILFLAPIVVDSVETKATLIDKCGLHQLFSVASKLDIAVVSCGDVGPRATSLARDFVSAKHLAELIEMGSICDVMCNFLDADGNSVPHPINDRVMSVPLETVAAADHVVLATGGKHRAPAIRAAIKRLKCNTLITDETAARALMEAS